MSIPISWLPFKPVRFEYNGKWIKNWFSNLMPSPIFMDGNDWEWPSVENYYQAMKTEETEMQEVIKHATPSRAKQLGRKLILRPNWDNLKEGFMKRALDAKFSQSPWYEALMVTGDNMIIEWNNWGDRYWGVTEDGVGKNRLGALLMQVREEHKKLYKSSTDE